VAVQAQVKATVTPAVVEALAQPADPLQTQT